MSEVAHVLLRDCLLRRLDSGRADWFNAQCTSLAQNTSDTAQEELDIALGLAPRRLGKEPLALDAGDLAAANRAIAGWNPSGWTVSDAARILLLLAVPLGKKSFAERFRSLCQTADMVELVTLYRGLPLYPEPQALLAQVGEGLRSNMRAVFEAIAHGNPYPKAHFDVHRWNHMVLKALFINSPLVPIYGLDERANAELAGIMCDFAHERWAAGRVVPFEIWRCVGPFAQGPMVDDLARVLQGGTTTERYAAALALQASPDSRAAQVLQLAPEITEELIRKKINWATLT